MKEEALELAEMLDEYNADGFPVLVVEQSANMLRRLVEELDKQKETIRNLNKTLGFVNSGYEVISLEPQTKPLSDEEIKVIATQNRADLTIPAYISFARLIEERHGIK